MKISILILVTMLIGCAREQSSWPTETFDSNRWLSTAEEGRYVYVRDLIDRRILVGKRASDIREILGPPSSVDQTGLQLSYLIKIGGSGFDSMYVLDILLDSSSGVVEEIGIRGD